MTNYRKNIEQFQNFHLKDFRLNFKTFVLKI